jgi:hypothetical protein
MPVKTICKTIVEDEILVDAKKVAWAISCLKNAFERNIKNARYFLFSLQQVSLLHEVLNSCEYNQVSL